ncbi:MAG: hypothetical protein AAFX92_12735 [Pseudomonadota bacterium]
MAKEIFLSVGGTANDEQERFVQAVENRLRAEGLTPNTVGRNTFSVDAPLRTVEHLMDRCCGTVVLALERSYFPEGVEKRGGKNEKRVMDVALPTPWNHIEAAMSYSRSLPLLVIVQEGLKHEGLLEPGYDWYVQTIPLDEAHLSSPQFNGVLSSWKHKVETRTAASPNRSSNEPNDVARMTIGQLVGSLKPAHLWSVLVALCAVIAGAFSLGAQL